ncbi:MAG TPA: NADH-specific enoyl-ACP reductase [Deltaproteobacteria bacterium]|nr:MAG: enoyl-ACP reductase [Deltaproteobacteria bacterium GWA2_55_82]OGQ64166.1 MAG: enoyl-ACP reductase [Deltaproteobacteria bacterium RIFCSPLOWO2_02_FULL_55_12]OIJ74619.1 MAG: enoyl-ACP reductase [Deltaproteobacteria bacterium GWC2_55_46]HBG46437.1 NADH-specific enoyl-ACP reductase [Deltaproteobacteria bacterium]HCY10649.1 NADH-specific enoyl-ACP reductase [Deltaproteobacteria bacterium]
MGLLDGRKGVIFGVANERSIAWAIAEALHREGMELAFTYAGEALESRVRPLASSLGSKLILPCDVTDDGQIEAVFNTIKSEWGALDALVHSVAFAKKEELKGEFLSTSRDGFKLALDVSAYSLVSLARAAAPLMEGRPGAIVTMSYYGSEKVIANYNVMGVAKAALEASARYLAADLGPRGIRINTISAGPIKTLAAAGISGFKQILDVVEAKAPMRRNVTQEDVAKTALYLLSDLSSGVTGEIFHVDSGYSIMGL